MSGRLLLSSTFVVAMVFAICGGACRGLVGIEDDPPTEIALVPTVPPTSPPPPPPAPVCGGYSYAQPKCATCANAKCCADATACMRNAECAALAACEHECAPDDAECLLRCELAHPQGTSEQRALGTCVLSMCSASCIPPRWACLDPPQKELVAAAASIAITYRLIGLDLKRVEGVTIAECLEGGDPNCENPVYAGVTNVSGEATLSVDRSVFEKRVVLKKAGYVTTVVYLPRLTRSLVATIGFASEEALAYVSFKVGAPVAAGKGHVLVNVLDCLSGFGGGVKLGLEPPGDFTPFYFANGEPAPVSDQVQATDANPKTGAYGGFLNVAPGVVEVRGTVAENGLAYARVSPEGTVSDRRRVVVSKDRITFVLLHAAPQ